MSERIKMKVTVASTKGNKIVVMTQAEQGFGDIVAAGRLISELQRDNPNQIIEWIIATPHSAKSIKNVIPTNIVPSTLIHSLNDIDANLLASFESELFVCFPDSGSCPLRLIGLILGQLRKKMTICSEYGCGQEQESYEKYLNKKIFLDYPDLTPTDVENLFSFFESGFDKDSLGVFTDPFQGSKEESLAALSLENKGLYEVLQNFSDSNVSNYFEKTSLFFGYFNGDVPEEDEENFTTIENYVIFCIKAGLINSKPNIDIVAPLTETQWQSILAKLTNELSDTELRKLGELSFLKKSSETLKTVQSDLVGNGNINIRVINDFPCKKAAMKHLMNMSDPFTALTGDQSFSEGLCLKKLILYQIMSWKTISFAQLIDLCKNKFGEDSPLYRFYHQQFPDPEGERPPDSKHLRATKQFWKNVLALYSDPLQKKLLLQQAEILGDFLITQHTLQEKLLTQIKVLLDDSRPKEDLTKPNEPPKKEPPKMDADNEVDLKSGAAPKLEREKTLIFGNLKQKLSDPIPDEQVAPSPKGP